MVDNLVTNGGVEDGLTGWGVQGDISINQSSVERHSGNYSLSVSNRTASWNAPGTTLPPLVVGEVYPMSVWVKMASNIASEVILTLRRTDLDGNTYTQVGRADANGTDWVEITGNYVHAANGAVTDLFLYIEAVDETASYYVDDLLVTGIPSDGNNDPSDPGTPGQYGLAVGQTKFLGNIIANNVPSNYLTYWNQVTPENASKWGSVERQRDVMNWTDLDRAYNFAKSNGLPFKFHVLVWGSQEPSWIGGLSDQEKREEVEEWIRLASERYPDVDMIDVVNEPQHAPASYRNAIGGDGATGWDWIVWSFEKARQYFPNAQLHLNDYGIINDPNAIRVHLEIAQILKDRGLIDAVAMQCHNFNVDTLSANNIQNNLNLLAAIGLPLYVSELDITGSTEEQQRQRYAEKFPIFWEHPAVKGVTLWGYREGATWREGTGILNADGSERSAMQWLKNYFNQ